MPTDPDDYEPPERNGLPIVPYEYRAHVYPWAIEAIRDAEAVFGSPEPPPREAKIDRRRKEYRDRTES